MSDTSTKGPLAMTTEDDIASLLERVKAATGPNNALDMEIEIALFKPDSRHLSVRANDAGTKLVYQRRDGRHDTHWADDYTLNAERREQAIALLTSLKENHP